MRSPGTRVWFQPGAGHAPESLQTHEWEYAAQVTSFLDEVFGTLEASTVRATLERADDRSATVRVAASGTSYVQITLTDDRVFQHELRVAAAATAAVVEFDTPFPIGLRDERLALVLDGLAMKRRAAGNVGDADRLHDLAIRIGRR